MTKKYTKSAMPRSAKLGERQLARRMWKSITRELQAHAQASIAKGDEILQAVNSIDDSVSIIARHLARVEEEKRNVSPEAK
jgi:hypothetical protein